MIRLSKPDLFVYVNSSEKIKGDSLPVKFVGYVSPYLVVTNGGHYTKHIYAGTQRIASKLGDIDAFGADPRRVAKAGHDVDNAEPIDFGAKYKNQNDAFTARFDSVGAKFNGKSLDDYINGKSFCCSGKNHDEIEKNSTQTAENAKIEDNLYFYHPDHLGSTSMVTNYDGEVSQNVAYIPYGEIFVEERNGSWATPFLFNAKELDEETGLYYYGARYLDPTMATWLSVDPMFEKYVGMSPYGYCAGNPVKMVDPDGRAVNISGDDSELAVQALQEKAKGLKLFLDNGILKYSKNGKKLNKADKKIKEIIDNEDINVNLTTTRKHEFKLTQEGNNHTFFGGAFLGNSVSEGGKSCDAYQLINMRVLNKMDKLSGNDYGTSLMHELTEAYEGAMISMAKGLSSPPSGFEGSVYTQAHDKATPQPMLRSIYINSDNTESSYPTENTEKESFQVLWRSFDNFEWKSVFTIPFIK